MTMNNATPFRQKLQHGPPALGTCVSFTDPTVTEALSTLLDFVWIDMEHSVLSLEAVQGHVMATKATATAALVRVPWNDPVLIKPVLDLGADGVIIPNVQSAEEARRAVAACLYPPQGIRGFGPRRPSKYGQITGPEVCRAANASLVVAIQIEHIDAIRQLDEIMAVPGVTTIVIGPNDLSGSMGRMAQPGHPEVRAAIESAFDRARRAGMPIGIAVGEDPEVLAGWIDRGASWVSMGNDASLLLATATRVAAQLRSRRSEKQQETR
jgi:2-dehydro-3-deoxyglucarate aldolase/4-hydroxy-2-oxoheptanedioate aldolase